MLFTFYERKYAEILKRRSNLMKPKKMFLKMNKIVCKEKNYFCYQPLIASSGRTSKSS